MPRKALTKFGLFVVGLALAGLVGLAGFSLLTRFVTAFNQGADPASIFRGNTLSIPATDEARWRTLTPMDETSAVPSAVEREQVLAAYWDAWNVLDRAHQTGDPSDVATRWAGGAHEQVLASMDPARPMTQAHGGHTLDLTYFSDDGSVIAFEDVSFVLTQTVRIAATGEEQREKVCVSASVVMTADQGFWRVRTIRLRYE